jgi:predicted N-formylglutamate amidohydrolase
LSRRTKPRAGRSRKRLGPLVLSCEHGSARVPSRYADLFAGPRAERALASHRGSDLGSLWLARRLAAELELPLVAANVTRLLIELNRSRSHPALFSEFSRGLDTDARARLVERYYAPYRERVRALIESRTGRVCHIGVHSFTPVLGGEVRRADIALLYDPKRRDEARFARACRCELRALAPELRVRFNYPYRGSADGLTTTLRRQYRPARYLGIELEVNQALLTGAAAVRRRVLAVVTDSLAALMRSGI